MAQRWLLTGAAVVTPKGVLEKHDVLIEDGRIGAVGPDLSVKDARRMDLDGLLVFPGFIDVHVHLRTPGQEHKETIATGTAAAAKGGFTTVFCMPNTDPVLDKAAVVEALNQIIQREARVHVIPIGAVTVGQKGTCLTEMADLKQAGCRAVSDDGRSVANALILRRAMEYAAMLDLRLIEHCQDETLTNGGVMNEGSASTRLGLPADPAPAETIIVARDIELVHYLKIPIHFAHMSLKRSIELIALAKQQGLPVTAEVCPHHFTLCDEDIEGFSTNYKVNPPLRSQEDRDALKRALAEGVIDCIATDHAPHGREEKERDFKEAPFGMIGLETAFGLVCEELVRPGLLDWPAVADRMAAAPARIMGLERKGEVSPGFDADLTIVDPSLKWTFREEEIVSKSKNSPFIGRCFEGGVAMTIVSGEPVFIHPDYRKRLPQGCEKHLANLTTSV